AEGGDSSRKSLTLVGLRNRCSPGPNQSANSIGTKACVNCLQLPSTARTWFIYLATTRLLADKRDETMLMPLKQRPAGFCYRCFGGRNAAAVGRSVRAFDGTKHSIWCVCKMK